MEIKTDRRFEVDGGGTARHGRWWQSLRRYFRGRGGSHLGRRAFWLARTRRLSKASIRRLRAKRFFQRFMARDESCRARQRKEDLLRSATNESGRMDSFGTTR